MKEQQLPPLSLPTSSAPAHPHAATLPNATCTRPSLTSGSDKGLGEKTSLQPDSGDGVVWRGPSEGGTFDRRGEGEVVPPAEAFWEESGAETAGQTRFHALYTCHIPGRTWSPRITDGE